MSAATLVLCLTGGGIASAAGPLPVPTPSTTPSAALPGLPGVPSPDQVKKAVTDVAASTAAKLTQALGGQTAAAKPPAGQPTIAHKSAPRTAPRATHPRATAHAARPGLVAAPTTYAAPAPAGMSASFYQLNAGDLTTAPQVLAPSVAPGATVQLQTMSNPVDDIRHHSGEVLRGLLVALAAAAAGALGAGHLTIARQSRSGLSTS